MKFHKPNSGECNPYYNHYIDLVQEDVIGQLNTQISDFEDLAKQLSAIDEDHAYGEDKWSAVEVMMHMVDTERVMSYRAMCISRGEKVNLPGYDQDEYIADTDFSHITFDRAFAELKAVREGTLAMLANLTEKQVNLKGTASNSDVTVNALIYIIAGHYEHHSKIMLERYL